MSENKKEVYDKVENKIDELGIDGEKKEELLDVFEEESKEIAKLEKIGDKPVFDVEKPPEDFTKFRKFKWPQQKLFLEEFSKTLNITKSVENLYNDDDVDFDIKRRKTVTEAKNKSEHFKKLFEEAKQAGVDRIEWEMKQHAVEGKVSMVEYDDEGNTKKERLDYSPEMLKQLHKIHSDKLKDEGNQMPSQIELVVNPKSVSDMEDVDENDIELAPNNTPDDEPELGPGDEE